ncbi:MAG: transcriptional regulator [Bacteroidales bacterium]|nr:transcriptional regulator [Bacteroidales bacterium]
MEVENNDYQRKLSALNKAFESKVRLGIMSVLMVNDAVDFSTLKSLLGLTDGNLASHTRALEELGYIQAEKKFVGRKPNTSYSVTKAGSKAFMEHLEALEDFFKNAPAL